MKKLLIILCILFCTVGCSNKEKQESEMSHDEILESIISADNYTILDVRTKEEFESGHVVGAINMPYDNIDIQSLDNSKTILVYCQSGKRSKIAFETLKERGFEVFDLGSYDSITLDKE